MKINIANFKEKKVCVFGFKFEMKDFYIKIKHVCVPISKKNSLNTSWRKKLQMFLCLGLYMFYLLLNLLRQSMSV